MTPATAKGTTCDKKEEKKPKKQLQDGSALEKLHEEAGASPIHGDIQVDEAISNIFQIRPDFEQGWDLKVPSHMNIPLFLLLKLQLMQKQ